MTLRQFCPTCCEIPGVYEDRPGLGCWVERQDHEHELPQPRPHVYLYAPAHDGKPQKWAAYLPLWTGNGWLGWMEHDTLAEAMEYARCLAPFPIPQRLANYP